MIDAKSVLRLMCLSGCVSLALCGPAGSQTIVGNISLGKIPTAATVDLALNKIYIVNYNSNFATVIDGATNVPTNVVVGGGYIIAVVNPVTNKVYITSEFGDLTVIDGATNAATLIESWAAASVAVDPATNKIYVPEGNACICFHKTWTLI